MSERFSIFSGTANPRLAAAIARALGVQPGAAKVERFPDGEVTLQLLDAVRSKEVFIPQDDGRRSAQVHGKAAPRPVSRISSDR